MKPCPGVRYLVAGPALTVCLALSFLSHAQQITDVEITPDPESDNQRLRITVDAPPMTALQLESNSNLGIDEWVDLPRHVLNFPGGPIEFDAPLELSKSFFRITGSRVQVSGSSDGVEFDMILPEDIELPTLLDYFRIRSQSTLYPRVMDTDHYDDSGNHMIPAGKYGARNPEDLTGILGFGLWGADLPKDDGRFAKTFKLTDFPQDGKAIPTPGGERPMEKWEDANQTRVPAGEVLEPGKLDMGFEREIKDIDGKLPLDDNRLIPPGREARAFLKILKNGGYEIEAAGLSDGGHAHDSDPPLPVPGSLVILASIGEKILFIGTQADPFALRAYDPPEGGIHGVAQQELADINLAIPLPSGVPEKDLPEIEIRIYRYVREILDLPSAPDAQPVLTPELLNRHLKHFEPLVNVPGREVAKILSIQQAPAVDSPTVTTLHRAGSNGSKKNIAVLGEGFANTLADQQKFDDYVEEVIMEDFLGRDIHPEILNAINVFRVNTYSSDSGVTQVDSSGTVTTARDTALDYRYSGVWSRCWMEGGPNTGTLINDALASACPQADIVFIVLNETSGGGCAGGSRFVVTLASSWSTVAHEFGHLFGKLGDEYGCSASSCSPLYTGDEPGAVNLTKVTNRNDVKWSEWIPSWRPVVTLQTHIASSSQDVGIFRGAVKNLTRWADGIFRPTLGGRMRSNSALHNPIGYTKIRDEARPFQEASFRKNVVGDFNGDGRDDVVLLDGRQLSLYLAGDRDPGPDDPMTGMPPRTVNGVLAKTWFATDRLRSDGGSWSWQIRPGDKLYAGDFDGDGDDDLYIFNGDNWNKSYLTMLRSEGNRFQPVRRYDANLPGWQMKSGDEHYVGDFDGDGRDDLFIYNGKNWNVPYFVMLRGLSSSLGYVRRYDQYLPGTWEMGRNERFLVGDFTGGGRDGIIAQDRDTWNQVHLRVFRINGNQNGLIQTSRYYGPIEGANFTWNMHRHDNLHVGDFDGDGVDDVALFNGLNWNAAYLGIFESVEGVLQLRRTYSNVEGGTALPGWGLQRQDRFWVADVDGDEDQDLIVYNHANWDSQYLGICRSNSSFALSGSWQKDWIGGWNLSSVDDFAIGDFRGNAGWTDLFVFNKNWFGLLRSHQAAYQLESINYKWITQHRYHRWGFW